MANYDDEAKSTRDKLNQISPTMCMAKWLQVSMHLPQGRTHSCYHPPTHVIPLEELEVNPNALHNTEFKMRERQQMLHGQRPRGCQYCWNVEDAPNPPAGGRLSDRHYRSSEWWVKDAWNEVVNNPWDHDIAPRYVEVNFNQACNFKCMYCSPHLSTAWEDDIATHGPIRFLDGAGHNNISSLEHMGLMPLPGSRKDNPYIDAFWKWFPNAYDKLKVFRMTGGEPLMDKNTFKVFDYIKENPNPNLEISLTTNLCPPNQTLFDKLLDQLKALEEPVNPHNETGEPIDREQYYKDPVDPNRRRILVYVEDQGDGDWNSWPQKMIVETLQGANPNEIFIADDTISFDEIQQTFDVLGPTKDEDNNSFIYAAEYVLNEEYNNWEHQFDDAYVKHISLFISVDSVGEQAEYMRDGLDWEQLKRNVDRLLAETERVSITFINTFNILSIPKLRDFVDYMLELRTKYGYENQKERNFKVRKQRVWFDIPYLRYPNWMTIQLADEELLSVIQSTIDYMNTKVLSDDEYGRSYKGFKHYEVLKLERDLAWAKEGLNMNEEELTSNLIHFYEYFKEYDRRRNKNFLEVFPEMKDFWNETKDIYEEQYG